MFRKVFICAIPNTGRELSPSEGDTWQFHETLEGAAWGISPHTGVEEVVCGRCIIENTGHRPRSSLFPLTFVLSPRIFVTSGVLCTDLIYPDGI